MYPAKQFRILIAIVTVAAVHYFLSDSPWQPGFHRVPVAGKRCLPEAKNGTRSVPTTLDPTKEDKTECGAIS